MAYKKPIRPRQRKPRVSSPPRLKTEILVDQLELDLKEQTKLKHQLTKIGYNVFSLDGGGVVLEFNGIYHRYSFNLQLKLTLSF